VGGIRARTLAAHREAPELASVGTVIILDTHAWLWLCLEPRRLSPAAATAIRRAMKDGGLAIASITLLEVSTMVARGRVVPGGTPETWLATLIDRSRVTIKDITPAVATLAAHLPNTFPGDPADRLIAATARAEGVSLVTRDARIEACGVVETIW